MVFLHAGATARLVSVLEWAGGAVFEAGIPAFCRESSGRQNLPGNHGLGLVVLEKARDIRYSLRATAETTSQHD
jgi:hypothetical protein